MNAHASILRDFAREPIGGAPPENVAGPSEAEIELMLARARGQARSEGYARGAEDAEAGFEREILLRLDAIGEGLSALAAKRDGASDDLLGACRGVLTAFLEAVSPRLAEINLVPELVATVEEAVAAAPQSAVTIEVAPDRVDDLAARLSVHGEFCRIHGAADLSSAEARVSWRGGFDLIDVRPAIGRALEILDARLTPPPTLEPPAEEEAQP